MSPIMTDLAKEEMKERRNIRKGTRLGGIMREIATEIGMHARSIDGLDHDQIQGIEETESQAV